MGDYDVCQIAETGEAPPSYIYGSREYSELDRLKKKMKDSGKSDVSSSDKKGKEYTHDISSSDKKTPDDKGDCKPNDTREKCLEYELDMNRCREAGGELEYECVSLVKERLKRKSEPYLHDVYPWRNYDWSYSRFVDNNYNTRETGATRDGSVSGMWDNIKALGKLAKGFALDNNPNSDSIATDSDLLLCDRIQERNRKGCEVINDVRRSYRSQPNPIKTSFGEKDMGGRNSSSFYFKFGTCKTKDNEERCKEKGYEYMSGTCYRPRYHYVNNRALLGNAPSVAKEMVDLHPINLGSILLKKTNYLGKVRPTAYGSYEIEPCDEEKEHFIFGDKLNTKAQIFFDMFFITFLVIVLVIGGGFLYLYFTGGTYDN